MSVKIRLKRMGSKKRPFYRIIATDSRNPRDGRFIETIGYYDPMKDPADVNIKEDLVFKWMERGAKPTDNTEQILRNAGVLKKWSLLQQGVAREELETKYDELKSRETPPMSAAERTEKKARAEALKTAEKAASAESAGDESGRADAAAAGSGDAGAEDTPAASDGTDAGEAPADEDAK